MDLFDFEQKRNQTGRPLADRARPELLDDFVGQEHLVGEGKIMRTLIASDQLVSMILWGPPGSGKTTLARIIAVVTKSRFVPFSAVSQGVKDLRLIVERAQEDRKLHRIRTIVFIDEIHRWNKAQQDSLLPYVEDGTVLLIGATTENPSFEVNSALLSRCRVFVLESLSPAHIKQLLVRALARDPRLSALKVECPDEVLDFLASQANGDARVALNALEVAVQAAGAPGEGGIIKLERQQVAASLYKAHHLYDRTGEQHYNIISALHKSLRGSDANASLYWLGRMLEAGEDPLYVARRLVRFASEDIGLADPQALVQAVAAYQASHFLGMPECNVHLAQCVAYMATCPKSNALYTAYNQVRDDVRNLPDLPVPLHLRNAPTSLMKDLGYGREYKYNPDFQGPVEQTYLPPELKGRKYLSK